MATPMSTPAGQAIARGPIGRPWLSLRRIEQFTGEMAPSNDPPSPPGPGSLYGPGARALQEHFDSRRLADRLAELTLHPQLDDGDLALVADQREVWVSTVDRDGWPDVSYKGGDPGFVKVISPGELQIPIYNGNGMWRTLGNIADTGRVGLLFVDRQRPWRMRVQGTGEILLDAGSTAAFTGAEAVLAVKVARVFPNCGRYIHQGEETSPYGPAWVSPHRSPSGSASPRSTRCFPPTTPPVPRPAAPESLDTSRAAPYRLVRRSVFHAANLLHSDQICNGVAADRYRRCGRAPLPQPW
ncbi:MAG: pyridoxamine 5'-phosphate oxidase family protein [Acidimicrobiales bacterium]